MIRLQGKYRLTFPVTPGEITFRGYGNDIETQTNIRLIARHRLSVRRPRALSFEFWLPGDIHSPFVEVEGYQGPRAWLQGLERISHQEVLVTIDELDLAWNVLIGPVDGHFSGKHADFRGSIELPLFEKTGFVTYSNTRELLKAPVMAVKPTKQRANTTGKTAPKQVRQQKFAMTEAQKVQQHANKARIEEKLRRSSGPQP
ncbi:hypothetical protein [Brevibacillus thermoruber]|jgi:hypothetical protein|uniref:Uncharacterized protein n=1 Tax=Brevibacillus thermoruber TaxID=33942 RepID=A0A9X3TUA4_9BACL|nr:hypothetical protein [Brevibacillus thermoruber]MDA5110320.1 hypothetical protein [Brevibacillus thermoruber]